MATGELEQMSRRAAALADERDSLMVQLRTQRPIAGRPVVSKKALGKNELAVDKENEAPERSGTPDGMSFARGETPGAVAEAALQLLQQAETDRGGETTKIVRFASPLLTPKSNANARLRAEGPDAGPIAGSVGEALEMSGSNCHQLKHGKMMNALNGASDRKYDEHIALEVIYFATNHHPLPWRSWHAHAYICVLSELNAEGLDQYKRPGTCWASPSALQGR